MADGTERITDFALHPIRDDRGQVLFLYPTGTDITEAKQAEEALRARASGCGSWQSRCRRKFSRPRRAGEVDYFNPQWMDFTGLTFEQIRDWGWTQFIHPDDVEENVRRWRRSTRPASVSSSSTVFGGTTASTAGT